MDLTLLSFSAGQRPIGATPPTIAWFQVTTPRFGDPHILRTLRVEVREEAPGFYVEARVELGRMAEIPWTIRTLFPTLDGAVREAADFLAVALPLFATSAGDGCLREPLSTPLDRMYGACARYAATHPAILAAQVRAQLAEQTYAKRTPANERTLYLAWEEANEAARATNEEVRSAWWEQNRPRWRSFLTDTPASEQQPLPLPSSAR